MRFIELGRERGQKIKVSCTANAITSMPKKKKNKSITPFENSKLGPDQIQSY